MSVYYSGAEHDTHSLEHYGVKGQKWGIRRFQNSDGTLTSAGKQRYGKSSNPRRDIRKDVKADIEKAYKLGKRGTYLGYASIAADKRAASKKASYEKSLINDPAELKRSTVNKRIKSEAANASKKEINTEYNKVLKEAKKDVERLKKKYGKEAVNDLVYNKKTGKLNEKTMNGKEVAGYVLANAASLTIGNLAHLPVVPVYYRKPAVGVGNQMAYDNYTYNVAKIRKKQKA